MSNKPSKTAQNPQQTRVVAAKHTSYTGPIPNPEHLEHYEEILPGLASRIVTMAEEQSAHRMQLELMVVKSQISRATLGQYFGFTLGVLGLAGGVGAILLGFGVYGVSITGISLVSLVSVFVIGRKRTEKQTE